MEKCEKCGNKEFIVSFFAGALLWNADTKTYTIWDYHSNAPEVAECGKCSHMVSFEKIEPIDDDDLFREITN